MDTNGHWWTCWETLTPQGLSSDTGSAYYHRFMQGWRATRPVDVARLNNGVFCAVLRKYCLLFAVLIPTELVGTVLIAHHRVPSMSTGHVLAVTVPLVLTGFLTHFVVGLLGVLFIVAVGSLAWWRHVLAIGGPSAALAALASASRRIVLRLAHSSNPAVVRGGVVRRDRPIRDVPEHPLLDQLRCSLSILSTAPPAVPIAPEDPLVRIDQLIARRIA